MYVSRSKVQNIMVISTTRWEIRRFENEGWKKKTLCRKLMENAEKMRDGGEAGPSRECPERGLTAHGRESIREAREAPTCPNRVSPSLSPFDHSRWRRPVASWTATQLRNFNSWPEGTFHHHNTPSPRHLLMIARTPRLATGLGFTALPRPIRRFSCASRPLCCPVLRDF